jgi:hypothetical protein
MELPALFYGLYRDVKPRTTRIINQIRKGADWMALVEAGGFLDVAKTPGMILLEGPSPLVGGQPHFQAWLLWSQMLDRWDKWGREIDEAIFQKSLTRPWSALGLVGGNSNVFWFSPKHRYRPFLRAVRQYWDLWDSVGARYSAGMQTPERLWSLPTNIKYVLVNLGIPADVVRAPLPPGGLIELIDRTERHLH